VSERQRRWGRPLAGALGIGVALALLFLAVDISSPARIAWEPTRLGEEPVLRAEGLVLQDRSGDTVWASRGYAIYRSRAWQPFERVYEIRPRLGVAWAGFSRTFRNQLRYQELVEVVPLGGQRLLAFAGGDVYRLDLGSGHQQRVHTLRYFGPGRGRGVMPHGVCRTPDGSVYYGEYATGDLGPGATIRIYRSPDGGAHWSIAHQFPPGSVRHVHSLQWDPYGRALWVTTGDRDAESRIGYSRDGARSFTWIGQGSQRFRAVDLVFLPDRVLWGMDPAPAVPSHVVSWMRASGQLRISPQTLPSPAYYALPLGPERALLTLAERKAAVWLVAPAGIRELLSWPVRPDPGRPHPAVRLRRSAAADGDGWLLLNPLRTRSDGAAIYRLREGTLPR